VSERCIPRHRRPLVHGTGKSPLGVSTGERARILRHTRTYPSRSRAPQACQLHGILLDHTRAWARASRGAFPLAPAAPAPAPAPGGGWAPPPPAPPSHDYVQCDAAPEAGLPDGIRWAQVKSTDRAVEKIIRVYSQVARRRRRRARRRCPRRSPAAARA
jgi:hypothetical protein